jgi:hypothetical protein
MEIGNLVQFATGNRRNQGRILIGRLVALWAHIARVRVGNHTYTVDREGVFPI